MMKLGKMKQVDIREIWPHEQYDFSEWLATEENLSELSDTVNLSLTDPEKEKMSEHIVVIFFVRTNSPEKQSS